MRLADYYLATSDEIKICVAHENIPDDTYKLVKPVYSLLSHVWLVNRSEHTYGMSFSGLRLANFTLYKNNNAVYQQ